MKEFINSLTGTRMMVADDREAEYLAAGHKPARGKAQETTVPPAPADGQKAGSEETSGAAEKAKPEPSAARKTSETKPAAQKKTAATGKQKPAAKK